jgi:4-amino-4-deoxy-L-arabinose transferase-like glycosyltransferase
MERALGGRTHSGLRVPRFESIGASRRRFALQLGFLTALGIVLRIVYTVWVAPWPPHGFDDESFFWVQSSLIATGHGFSDPMAIFRGRFIPSAAHPPAYPLMLAAVYGLGEHSALVQRLLGTLTGAATIVTLGVLTRRIGGDRAGLIAASLAAVYPMLITADGAMMSESLYGFLVALSLLAAYRLLDRPSVLRGLVLGLTIGLGALTRGEALLLLPLLLVPVITKPSGGRAALATCIACVAVLLPWTVRNVTVFHRPVIISTDLSTAIAGANCPETYYGHSIGDWVLGCVKAYPGNEAQASTRAMNHGIQYALDHLTRLPIVAGARLLRVWGIRSGFPFGTRLPHIQGRDPGVLAAGYLIYVALLALAARGLILLRRLGKPVWIPVCPFILVTVVAIFVYGNPRLREPAELSIVVLSAIAIAHDLSALRSRGVAQGNAAFNRGQALATSGRKSDGV